MNTHDQKVKLIRDHSHARVLYILSKKLQQEKKDTLLNQQEREKIETVIQILHKKEQKLKNKHNKNEWYALGDYTLFN